MAGSDAHADRIDQYPDYRGSGQPQTNVLFSYLLERDATASNGWVPLGPTRYFGSELTFAKSLKKHGYERVAIIKSAVGGTTLFKDWNPDAPEEGLQLYPKTLNLVQESLAALDEKGIPWRLEAVLWHQGENDMLNRQEFMKYGQRLKPFIARLRQDLEIPELKFFIGEISEKGIWGMDHRPFVSAVKVQQLQVAEQDEKTWFVPTSHLAFEVMNSGQPHYHFGTQGQLQLGDALAEAWLETMGTKTARNQNTYGETLPLDSDKKVRLFILAGQRNIEGEDAFISELNSLKGTPPTWKAPDSTVYRYSLGGGVRKSLDWAELSPPDYLGNFGPELSMGKRLRYLIDDGIAMVKFTHSGAQGPDWFPDGSKETHRDLYPRFIAFVQQAIDDLKARGYEVTVEGVFWHPGENDTYFHYHKNLGPWMKQLIARSRADLKLPHLKWFISEQHEKAIWRNMTVVNEAMNKLAQEDANITVIKTSHLPHQRLHFGTRGTILLGESYATAWAKESLE
jgi:hypothetical protein